MLVNPTLQSSLRSSRAACSSSRWLASLASIISSTSLGDRDAGVGARSRRRVSSSRACCKERRVGAAAAVELEAELRRGASAGRLFAVSSVAPAAVSMALFWGTRARGCRGAAASAAATVTAAAEDGTAVSFLLDAAAFAALLHLSSTTTRPMCLRDVGLQRDETRHWPGKRHCAHTRLRSAPQCSARAPGSSPLSP